MSTFDELKKMLKETEEKIKEEMGNIDSEKVSKVMNDVKSQVSESAKKIFDNKSEEIKEEESSEEQSEEIKEEELSGEQSEEELSHGEKVNYLNDLIKSLDKYASELVNMFNANKNDHEDEKEEELSEEQTDDIKDNTSEEEKTIASLVREYIELSRQSKKINSNIRQTKAEIYGKVKGQITEISSSVKQGVDNISSTLADKASQAKEYVKNMTSSKEKGEYDSDMFDDDFFRDYTEKDTKYKMFNHNGKTFIEIESITAPESTEELLEKMRKNQKIIDEMMEECKEINEKVKEKLQIADDKDISVSERLTILKQFVMEINPKKESKVEINEPYTYIGTFATIMDYKTNKAYECIVDRDDVRAEYRLYYDSKNNELKLPIPTADKFEEEYEIIFPKLNKKTK